MQALSRQSARIEEKKVPGLSRDRKTRAKKNEKTSQLTEPDVSPPDQIQQPPRRRDQHVHAAAAAAPAAAAVALAVAVLGKFSRFPELVDLVLPAVAAGDAHDPDPGGPAQGPRRGGDLPRELACRDEYQDARGREEL